MHKVLQTEASSSTCVWCGFSTTWRAPTSDLRAPRASNRIAAPRIEHHGACLSQQHSVAPVSIEHLGTCLSSAIGSIAFCSQRDSSSVPSITFTGFGLWTSRGKGWKFGTPPIAEKYTELLKNEHCYLFVSQEYKQHIFKMQRAMLSNPADAFASTSIL